MNANITEQLRYTPCIELESDYATNPLDALRRKVADSVEKLFIKYQKREIVLGCMHYPKSAGVDFYQTQTSVTQLLPQTIRCEREDHSHENCVTIDLRVSPDECYELELYKMGLFIKYDNSKKVGPCGPDFARRNLNIPEHIDDFSLITNVDKIYAERVPAFEKGPCASNNSNIHIFNTLHKILRVGGILKFDYMPAYALRDLDGRPVLLTTPEFEPKPISQADIDAFVLSETYGHFFAELNSTITECKAHREGCPDKTCASLVNEIATAALQKKQEEAELVELYKSHREAISAKPKTELLSSDVYIGIGKAMFPLDGFEENIRLPINDYPSTMIWIRASGSKDEIHSLDYQLSCCQTLNVNPHLESHIHPKTKAVFERAVLALVNKVVLPQLKQLGFEEVSFDLNNENLENKRLFERVVYAKKIELANSGN